VVCFDGGAWTFEADAFDDIGVERALKEKFYLSTPFLFYFTLYTCPFLLEYVNEGVPDDLSLLFGVFDAGETLEEERRGVGYMKVHSQVFL